MAPARLLVTLVVTLLCRACLPGGPETNTDGDRGREGVAEPAPAAVAFSLSARAPRGLGALR